MKYNENFRKLSDSYVFAGINARKATAKEKWGDKLLDLGVGDVKLPLFPVVAEEMKKALDEMTTLSGFKGYSPSSGYDFLKEAIAKDYSDKGVAVRKSEIFINDGAKEELYDIFGLLNPNSRIIVPTPCYPAVAEANLLLGNEVIYIESDDDFVPYPPFGTAADAVYLCSPSNPSGAALDYKTLALWVNYAISANAVIVFDGAYSDYLSDGYPDSIFRVPNARRCSIEVRSFSKGYGFTGLRLGYSVIPEELPEAGKFKKRKSGCSDNGVSYVTQRGGLSCLSAEGRREMKKRVKYYKDNAEILRQALKSKGLKYATGDDSPYVYARCPEGFTDESLCGILSDKLGIIATPGKGFNQQKGEYFRLSAFAPRKEIFEASDRLSSFNFSR